MPRMYDSGRHLERKYDRIHECGRDLWERGEEGVHAEGDYRVRRGSFLNRYIQTDSFRHG